MDDAIAPLHPMDSRAVAIERIALPDLQALRLLGTPRPDVRQASEALGFELAQCANRLTDGAPRSVRLGPAEWLIFGGSADDISAALNRIPHHVCEVGPGRIGWRASGPAAADLIACGCSMDLHDRAFPAGSCVRTLLAQAGVVLRRPQSESCFELVAEASLDDYLSTWLRDAAQSFIS